MFAQVSNALVTDFLFDLLDFTSTRKEIIAKTGLPPSTVDGVLRRLLLEKNIKRIQRGTYKLVIGYKKITYSIRILATNSAARNKHVWAAAGEDIEVIAEGTVPAWLTPEQIDKALFDKLVNETLNVISEQDPAPLQIPDNLITFETKKGKGLIRGVEEIGIAKSFDNIFAVEVLFTNNISIEYVYNSVMRVNEADFTG